MYWMMLRVVVDRPSPGEVMMATGEAAPSGEERADASPAALELCTSSSGSTSDLGGACVALPRPLEKTDPDSAANGEAGAPLKLPPTTLLPPPPPPPPLDLSPAAA